MTDARTPGAAAAGRPSRRWTAWLTAAGLVALLFLAWHVYVTRSQISSFILPSPGRVLVAYGDFLADPRSWAHTWATVYETLVGFFWALLLGIALGLAIGRLRWLETVLNPFIVATQVVPKVALVPLFVVWFGFGATTKILLAAVLAFFPILSNTVLGVKSVDLGHRDVMTSLAASRWKVFTRLELPSALPSIITGMEVGIVLAIIGAVVGEYLGGNVGLGYLLIAKMNAYETDGLFAVIIHLTLVGFLFYAAVGLLRRVLIPWHESVLLDTRGR